MTWIGVSIDSSPNISIEYNYKKFRGELSTDFKSFEFLLSKPIKINKYTDLVPGIGFNKNVFVKLNMENTFNLGETELRIEPCLIFYDYLDWELVIGFNMLEVIINKDSINLGFTIEI